MRSLGCVPCTGAIRSEADTVPKIIEEMISFRRSERENRVIDHDEEGSMETKKRERSEEHTSELQSLAYLVCRLLLEKKKKTTHTHSSRITSASLLSIGNMNPTNSPPKAATLTPG